MPVSLFIGGDVVPRMDYLESFKEKGNIIFEAIRPHIHNSDLAVVNLEAPVVNDQLTPIKKDGPSLYTSESTIEVLKEVGFSVVTLANNHFFDQGQQGVNNTIDTCEKYNINIVGGGKSYIQARKYLVLERNDKRIALINACENEFSIANDEHGGSNPIDIIYMQEDITKAHKEADYVIIITHGGIEHYQYPTPRMKRWYHHFVDLGADAVVNHHQHCVNGYEVYKGKPIFYGLGNFYFPQLEGMPKNKLWGYGYAVELTLNERIDFKTIPYYQDREGIRLREKGEFEKEIALLNKPIADDNLLQQTFDKYIVNSEYFIKNQLLPSFLRNRLFSGLARRGYLGKLYKGNSVFDIYDKITCESHSEKLQRLFEILTRK